MAITFSGAVSAAAPAVYNSTPSQATGAVGQGIGLKGADGAAVPGAMYIGGVAAPLKFDTDANVATP